MEERKRNFQRSAEFFEKALQLDGSCAYAAQGLAIVLAEDALGGLSAGGVNQESEGDRRARLRSALDVFGKVRESVSEDGGVYFNMGHCYYGRDEYDRAIESVSVSSSFVHTWRLISFLVRNLTSNLWWTEYVSSSVPMSVLVREGDEGSELQSNADRAEVCATGSTCFAFRQSHSVQHRHDTAKVRRDAVWYRSQQTASE